MIHPVTVLELNVNAKTKVRDKGGEVERYDLDIIQPRSYGLFYKHPVENNKRVSHFASQVIPQLNLQVTRFTWRSDNHPYGAYDYYVDIIGEVKQDNGVWTIRDLYLDVLVFEGKWAKIIDTEEYLQAVDAEHFLSGERELALERTHWLVNQLGEHGYSLERFLAQHDIRLEWD